MLEARDVWNRYSYLRDNGHHDFVEKARLCERFFSGDQWEEEDLMVLRAQRRPALTVNKILNTVANVLGKQVGLRSEVLFKPRSGLADEQVANTLTKLFMHVADQNQYAWCKSEVFTDGLITSRGFFDVRMSYEQNLLGDVVIQSLNAKNVLIDIDADRYDPDDWSDVIVSRWMSPNEIELYFGKEAAKLLRAQGRNATPYEYDVLDIDRDRFGTTQTELENSDDDDVRYIRVIERQAFQLTKRDFFVDLELGSSTPVPDGLDDELINEYLRQNESTVILNRPCRRVRWSIVAGDEVLYDDWSLYEHFTVVPYFPYFRRGKTMGLVENLIDPQQVLNKVTSQELHVINTSANSGWITRQGNLTNMDIAELEERGAETGLVIEVDDISQLQKIQPNQIPTGLDRMAYKAEEFIKSISGVSDYQTGFAREDVSSKAITRNQEVGALNQSSFFDAMNRTEHLLAKRVMKLFQGFYTDERIFRVLKDPLTGENEELTINQQQEDGSVLNDLTLGEYDVVIASQPERDRLEESQFDQAVRLRTELGIAIDDEILIEASQLIEKRKVIEKLREKAASPEQQEAARLQIELTKAQLAKERAEAMDKTTRAQHNQAKMQRDMATARERNRKILTEEEYRAEEIALEREKLAIEREKLAIEREKLGMTSREVAARILQAKRSTNDE